MELLPALGFGWLNGWVLLIFEFLIQGGLLLIFPKAMVSRLFDRSGWSARQTALTILGKVFSLVCLILIILTPLKFGTPGSFVGLLFYVLGLAGLVQAMLNFRDTPPDKPVTKGVYKISRHPQIASLFFVFLGISLTIGSWAALFALVLSKVFQHFGILAEEEACLRSYGQPYRELMERVPRYLLFL